VSASSRPQGSQQRHSHVWPRPGRHPGGAGRDADVHQHANV